MLQDLGNDPLWTKYVLHNSSVGILALGGDWIIAAEFSLRELVFLEAAEETRVLPSFCEDEVPSVNKEIAPHQTQTCWCLGLWYKVPSLGLNFLLGHKVQICCL